MTHPKNNPRHAKAPTQKKPSAIELIRLLEYHENRYSLSSTTDKAFHEGQIKLLRKLIDERSKEVVL